MMHSYEHNPEAIERRSFELIRGTLTSYAIDGRMLDVAVRVVHAAADFSLANLLEWSHCDLNAARAALARGGKIFCDVDMLRAGISKKFCGRYDLEPISSIHEERIAARAARDGITRAMAAVDAAVEDGVRLFAFGNAPTALFRLVEHMEKGASVDFVCGMPVGFVGAADSKAALAEYGAPALLLRGPRGGSNLCAAALNAILREGNNA